MTALLYYLFLAFALYAGDGLPVATFTLAPMAAARFERTV